MAISDIYRKILEDTMAGYWDWDMVTNSEYLSPRFKQMFGYEDHEMENSPESWQKIIFPEDLPILYAAVNEHVGSRGQVPFDTMARYYHKNGSTIYVQCKGSVIEWDENYRPLRMVGSHVDITKQKEVEANLRQAQDFLNKTNQAARVGGWQVDMLTQYITWSEVTRLIYEEPIDFVPNFEESLSYFHSDDSARLVDEFMKCSVSGQVFQVELPMRTAKGNNLWVRIIGSPEYIDGQCVKVVGALQDITKIKAAEDEIRLKKDQLSHFIEFSPAAMAMFDMDMGYIAASSKWSAIYKLDEELTGKSFFDVLPQAPEEWKKYHDRSLAGEIISIEAEPFVWQDGTIDWFKWEIRPWYEMPGKIGGIVKLIDLITDQVAARELLLNAKLVAEEALESKSRFLSTMSHEIRTPLNAIIGISHLMLNNPREDQLENLSTLRYSAENLLVLINNVLDLSKVEAGKVVLEKQPFSFKEMLSNIKLSFLGQVNAKGLQLKLMLDEDIPETIIGDPMRIGQIFSNLIGNAIKFTEKGKVSVSATLISKENLLARLRFEISDTGIGIAKENQQFIFESFSQANSNIARTFGGTGLGLAISKHLLHLFGSEIELESELGQGSKFSFEIILPVCQDAAYKQVQQQLEKNIEDVSLKGLKVLLAEDNKVNVLVMSQYFKNWNVEWDLAENGLIAVEKINANDYDLVLMDLQMPELDGFRAVEIIREQPNEKYQKLPIIALTASASFTDRERSSRLGLNGYITKPFKPKQLHEMLFGYYTAKEGTRF